jgi:hypothetical protein
MTTRLRHPGKLAAAVIYYRERGNVEAAERIELELAAARRCRRCGRTLTDPVSVELGIGPDCRARADRDTR